MTTKRELERRIEELEARLEALQSRINWLEMRQPVWPTTTPYPVVVPYQPSVPVVPVWADDRTDSATWSPQVIKVTD